MKGTRGIKLTPYNGLPYVIEGVKKHRSANGDIRVTLEFPLTETGDMIESVVQDTQVMYPLSSVFYVVMLSMTTNNGVLKSSKSTVYVPTNFTRTELEVSRITASAELLEKIWHVVVPYQYKRLQNSQGVGK